MHLPLRFVFLYARSTRGAVIESGRRLSKLRAHSDSPCSPIYLHILPLTVAVGVRSMWRAP